MVLSEGRKYEFTTIVSQIVNHSFETPKLVSEISDVLNEYLSIVAVCLYDLDGGNCRLSWARGVSAEFLNEPDIQTLHYSSASARRAIRHRSITFVADAEHEPTSFASLIAQEGMRSIAWIPLQARGRILGLLAVAREAGALPFLKANNDILEFLGRELGISLAASISDADLYARLRDLEAKHRFLHDDSPSMYVALDADGTITHCNSTVLRALGYGGEELIGREINVLLRDYDEKLREAKGLKPGSLLTFFETVAADKRGDEHDLRVTSKSLMDPDDKVIGAVLILEDVTERNRLESENQYKSLLVDSSTDTMFVRSVDDGSILYANEAAWKIRGYTREEFLRLKPADMAPKEFEGVTRRLHEKVVQNGGFTAMCPQLCKNGSVREMEVTANRLDHRGRTYATVIMRDLTERNRLQRELERVSRIESLGRLAAGLAHDFNNMLAGIIGHASLLRAQSAPDGPIHKSADTIEKTASHAAEIVSRLMVFARGEDPKLEVINLNETAEDVISLLSGSLPSSIKVTKVLSPDVPHIQADRTQLMQCALNLCLNARDAMPQGGILGIKTFNQRVDKPAHAIVGNQLLPEGLYAGFTVRDTGVGMDDETQRKVFEPYFTTKDASEGHGFGLATTYGIVRRHKGYINVRSVPGVGARFTMLFPAVETPRDARVEKPGDALPGDGTILVVEDDDTVRDFLKIALSKSGYAVILAENGKAALKEFSDRVAEIDAVILDLKMPGMSGEKVCEELKKIDPDVRILISSGYSETEQQLKGTCGYLRKPYRLHELLNAVRSAIGRE
ncbi:MAG: PAS domain S-box protein [Armatimonadota bacterium]|nr:PAS domain S-box protein [Armatimonadota bacterium]